VRQASAATIYQWCDHCNHALILLWATKRMQDFWKNVATAAAAYQDRPSSRWPNRARGGRRAQPPRGEPCSSCANPSCSAACSQ
jgi:hypothetical protein